MIYAENVVDKLINSKHVVIYGAGHVAQEVAVCLLGEPYNLSIEFFVVSSLQDNPSSIFGIPVVSIDNACLGQEVLVIVAALEKYQDEIINNLTKHKYNNILLFGFESRLWGDIRGNYLKYNWEKDNRNFLTIEDELIRSRKNSENNTTLNDDVVVYMAKSHVDKVISYSSSEYEWETAIQVGSALTAKKVCDITDDVGDNISHKNQKYCELTALYWIWKNDSRHSYIGLCHYRRHFCILKDDLKYLEESGIDVVLTIPILNYPSVKDMYKYDHDIRDWNIMINAIEILHPDYISAAYRVQNGQYYYAYNMFIARNAIFIDYCNWLFPVLSYCEDKIKDKNDKYQNRVLGFLAERLMTIYFAHHQNDYKIVHARKDFWI